MSIRNYKLNRGSGDIEPHEVFLDTLARVKEDEIGISERRFEVPLRAKAAYVILGVFFFFALVLLSKVFYLQAVEGKHIAVEAENNKGSSNIIMPSRGIVYDKNFKTLVLNAPAYDFVCSRSHFAVSSPAIDAEISAVSGISGIAPEEIRNTIQSSDTAEVLVMETIGHEQLLNLEAKQDQIPGCSVRQNTMRNYVTGPIFSQVLGYTGRINKTEYANSEGYSINDYIGKTGLEKQYEAYLRGTPGRFDRRKPTDESVSIAVEPKAGDNLVLHIDGEMQSLLYKSLETKLKDIGAKRGAAVAMDPRTGAVLALVSYPSYDDNAFSGGISQADYQALQNNPNQPLFNRAIAAHYPTGSVIKPLEAAAALQEKLISPDKKINDPGYIEVRSSQDSSVSYRFGGVKPHGWVDMRQAIAVSSNIYFYTVGGGYEDQKGLGPNNIKKYLSLFGWNEKTGIDLPGEFGGFIPDPEWKKRTKGQSWYDGDTYNLSIGQSDLQTTPLQVAMAYSAIANGGTLYRPHIVDKVVSGSGANATTVKQFSPEVIRSNIIDEQNLQVVREGMRDAVTKDYGLSRILNDLPVSAAAKTGTAEIGYQTKFNLWSATFAPYENPEIVIVVTAEEVNALGAVTLPVSHDVLKWYFSK